MFEKLFVNLKLNDRLYRYRKWYFEQIKIFIGIYIYEIKSNCFTLNTLILFL